MRPRNFAHPTRQARLLAPMLAPMLALVLLTLPLGGCIIAPIMDNYYRTSTKTVKAQYTKLEDKTFAVIISAGRGIETEAPGVPDEMLMRVSFRLSQPVVGAAGVVPPLTVVKTLYDRPQWQAMTYQEIAKDLLCGVDRLVLIELEDFRLTDPGNAYEWNGVAAGRVLVIESDGVDPNQIVFEKYVSVKFPDKPGWTPQTMKDDLVISTLLSRFVDRATWLFYDHQEPYYPEY